ncbi:LysM peptidoglycan-binding domain-containing protein [candidate division TA06 bacterium]|nr:LysM peptidoglycan-binding domain-containing protein [candidate division TA06 bacterium]
MELIAGYQQRADAAQAMIDKEQGKIEELRKMIRDLDQKIVACEEELAMQAGMDTYTVVRGDWLAKLAEYDDVYGHGYYARWIEIYRANRDIIGDNPNRIYPGQVYNIPRP